MKSIWPFNTIHQADADVAIYLFRSRVDDTVKGDDIDLLVLPRKINLTDRLEILAQLHRRIDERKIDILIYHDTPRPFPGIVIQTGLPL